MAEALGLAAGIAGLLSLTIETYRISAKYISGVRNASKLVTDLLRELDALKKVLVDLDGLIAGVDEDVVSRLCLSNSIGHRDFGIYPLDTFRALTVVPRMHRYSQAIDRHFFLLTRPSKSAREQLTT
jgi:hypothetical protein